MFRKTIQNIQSSRNINTNYPQQGNNGYNTQRYQRYPSTQIDQQINSQRRTLTNQQFHQLKKNQNTNKQSELVIRQCNVEQLNQYKKNTPRQIQQQNSYQFNGSSSKKQKLGISSRKTYDSNYRQPLKQYYMQRQNTPRNQRYSSNLQTNSTSIDYQQQIQGLKQYVFKIHQQFSNQMKKNKNQNNDIRNQCMSQLQNIANQISKQLTKQKQQIFIVNKNTLQTRKQLKFLKQSFNSFVKDNQQKIQSIVLDLNGNKKSRNIDQFGVDLKSSSSHCISGGVGTSMSINLQSQNFNVKLYNQMLNQMQVLKNQLQKCKQNIQNLQKDTKNIQLIKQNSNKTQQPKTQSKQKIDFKQVQKIIIMKFQQQFKKNQIIQKLNDLDLKNKDLYRVYQDMDGNIKGMNAQFTRVINGTVIKKQKMLQAKVTLIQQKITEIFEKVNPLTDTIKEQIKLVLQQKSSNIKIIKTRQTNTQQKSAIQSLKQANITYMVDQQGYLMDQQGSYILQDSPKGKSKIKIEKDLYYLLECQGIQIKAI